MSLENLIGRPTARLNVHMEMTGSTGSPVVFLHEFAGDSTDWKECMAVLAKGHRCYAFNARGYAPSPVPSAPEDYSQAHALEDLDAVIRLIGQPVHLVGISMGAVTALMYALSHPDLCLSLCVVSIGTGMNENKTPQSDAGLRALASAFQSGITADQAVAITRRFAGPHLERKNPAAWAKQLAFLQEMPAVPAQRILEGIQLKRLTFDDLAVELRDLQMQVLIIAGDDDAECLKGAFTLRSLAKSSKLFVVPGTGHLVPQEEAELFCAVLQRFIRDSDSIQSKRATGRQSS